MVEFGILGPMEVRSPAGPITVGAPRQRAVLAVLLLAPNRVVSLDAVVDAIWGDDPPRTARHQVQNLVSELRLAFAQGDAELPVTTHAAGYELRLDPHRLDAAAFEREAELARRWWTSGAAAEAAEHARAALRHWRGAALTGVAGPGPAAEAARLEELRLEVLERRIDADMALGRHQDVVGELTTLVRSFPLRERLRGQLMTALYRTGRRIEALATYDSGRRLLAEQFGVDPGTELTTLRQAILTDCPSITGVTGAAPAAAPAPGSGAVPGGAVPGGAVPAQLGPWRPGFVGREHELATLRDALAGATAEPRPVVLLGAPGAGTTTLAVHAAREAAPRYPDGQLQIALRGPDGVPVDPADALADALRALGVAQADLPAGADARTGLYRTRLADRRVLVLLDDAAGADQVRPLLPVAAGSAALVTGPPALAALEGVRMLRVGPLADPDGAALLASVAGPAVAVDTGDAYRIVQACEGLPGAIHAAGAWLARFPGAGSGQLAALLEDEARRLGALALADGRVRRRLRSRYDRLGRAARRAFRRLGTSAVELADPATLGELFGVDPVTAGSILDELAEVELVEVVAGPHGIRYRLDGLVRCFAHEAAAGSASAEVRPVAPLSVTGSKRQPSLTA